MRTMWVPLGLSAQWTTPLGICIRTLRSDSPTIQTHDPTSSWRQEDPIVQDFEKSVVEVS